MKIGYSAWIVLSTFLLSVPAFGGLDQSRAASANGTENLNTDNLAAVVSPNNINTPAADMAPQAVATGPTDAAAIYTSSIPPAANQRTLTPFDIMASPPMHISYMGTSMSWEGFLSTFPSNTAGPG